MTSVAAFRLRSNSTPSILPQLNAPTESRLDLYCEEPLRRSLGLIKLCKLVVQARNEQSRMRISRNIVTRVSKVRPNARSWACLHWKSDSVRLQKFPIDLSSRSA